MPTKLMVTTVTVYENDMLRHNPAYHGNASSVVTIIEFDTPELAEEACEKIKRQSVKSGKTTMVYNSAVVL